MWNPTWHPFQASAEESQYTKQVCGNCWNQYIRGDKYCRYCGAVLGEPVTVPDNMECIYGPPPEERTHTCKKCGLTWTATLMIDNERFCPDCGGECEVTLTSGEDPYAILPEDNDDSWLDRLLGKLK